MWPTHNDSGYESESTMPSSVTAQAYSLHTHTRKYNATAAESWATTPIYRSRSSALVQLDWILMELIR